ncbi:MAG TPA: cupredoxin domain-containing protein [Actinomycetota bacterium]|jgi:plastocyanin
MRSVGGRLVIGLLALVLLAVACGSEPEESSDGGGTQTGAGQTGASGAGATGDSNPPGGYYGGAPGSTGSSGATSTGSTGSAAGDVSVSLNNYLFQPTDVEVNSGDVVSVRNDNTRTPHTFTVTGEDVDLELAPMETETAEIDLAPGTYDLICRFHEELGMVGTLTVT